MCRKKLRKSNQTLGHIAASIVPKVRRNSFFFFDGKSINETIIRKDDLNLIVTTRLKRFLYNGYLDKNLIKKINKFKNLEDIQLRILNQINFNIKINLDQIRNLVVEFAQKFEFKFIIDNNMNKLKTICIDYDYLQIKNKESIEEVYYLCDCDLNNIINLKNLKILHFPNSIDNELINKIRTEFNHLDMITLETSYVSEENILQLKEIVKENQNLIISLFSIKLNSNAIIDSNKCPLENQILNYDYLNECIYLDDYIINFNDLINFTANIIPQFKFDSKFFNYYRTIETIKVTLNSSIQFDKLKDLLKNIINLNKLIIIIEDGMEYSLEDLINGLAKKIICLEIKKMEDDHQLNLDFLFNSDMWVYLASFETNVLIDNRLLRIFKDFIQLENLEFRKVINQKTRKIIIVACDDENGDEWFAIYLDENNDYEEKFSFLDKSIDYVINKYN